MTQDEIIEMAQECGLVGMRPHLDGIYIESLLAFAKLVEEKALAEHAMQEVQRLGQEIEQEPVPPPWWPAVENILNEYGLQAIDFVADFKQALAQEQEPVAWISPKGHIHFDPYLDSVPLYTTPPQRTWVGLTRDEQSFVYSNLHNATSRIDSFWVDFANAIEAKLKERNT